MLDMAGCEARVLAELTEIGMSMARELQARCRSAETADEVQVLMLAFQRVSRSVRLSLALRVRLERQRRELLRDDHVVALRRTDARKAQVRTVDRSERIRTYNFPQNRISDHRIGYTAYNLDLVIGGDMDGVLDALTEADRAARLAGESDLSRR